MGDSLVQVSTWIYLKAWKANPHSESSVDNIGGASGHPLLNGGCENPFTSEWRLVEVRLYLLLQVFGDHANDSKTLSLLRRYGRRLYLHELQAVERWGQ